MPRLTTWLCDHIYWSKRLAKYSGLSSSMVKLMQTQQFKCTCCGDFFRQGDIMEIDHKIPKSRGGKDEYDNLQVLHKICHVNKTRDENTPLITVPKSKLMPRLTTWL
jgi:RNA-directed DNA polymerase